MSTQVVTTIYDIDPDWDARTEEDKIAMREGALCAPGRKMQCWGLPTHWREAGPFDWTNCDDIVVMPGRLSGVPTVGDLRFSADNLLQLHEWGMSADEIVQDYSLDLAVVRRVLDFAAGKSLAGSSVGSGHVRSE
jgi:uncharacterized protein (DUF433 family)